MTAWALVATFSLCSIGLGVLAVWLVAARGGPAGRAAAVLPVIAAFGAFYLIGHKLGLSVGPEVSLFGFQVALLGDLAIGFAAALAVALAQAAIVRARRGGARGRRDLGRARLVAGRHGPAGARPVAVRARVEDRVREAGDPHRQRVVARGHAAAAVGHDVAGIGQALETCAQDLGRLEPTVGCEVAAARPADGRRDVAADRVDGLGLASVALGCAGVDEADAAQPCRELVAVDRPRPAVGQREPARAPAWGRPPSGGRRSPSTPRSRRRARGLGDGRGRRASTTGARRSSRRRRRRPRSPSCRRTRARPSGAANAAGEGRGWRPGPARRGEVGVEVHEHRSGDVPGLVVAASLGAVGEPPADVGDPQIGVADARHQGLGGEQGHRCRGYATSCYPLRRRRDGAPWTRADEAPAASLRRSSVVERATVNHLVVGSNPTAGASFPSTNQPLQADPEGLRFGVMPHASCRLKRPLTIKVVARAQTTDPPRLAFGLAVPPPLIAGAERERASRGGDRRRPKASSRMASVLHKRAMGSRPGIAHHARCHSSRSHSTPGGPSPCLGSTSCPAPLRWRRSSRLVPSRRRSPGRHAGRGHPPRRPQHHGHPCRGPCFLPDRRPERLDRRRHQPGEGGRLLSRWRPDPDHRVVRMARHRSPAWHADRVRRGQHHCGNGNDWNILVGATVYADNWWLATAARSTGRLPP